ncbi:hypothetical protein A5893_13985 [Pedobacter psychrophilus]|uniref:Uncharacterized protein YyaB-like PH domain-containing protein n=1 Tax=Pedobacter psychrophilus TaxID=1826909 RepID=A0A179DDD2_9SPHI|nr:PH domain-containing protein [Pedobacter psychrophilus]OAQ38529.1 hypothetical protein A5893_13985 [Pedobacter psychrophilus]
MPKIFKSRKDQLFIWIIIIVVSMMLTLSISDIILSGLKLESFVLISINLGVSILLFWIFFGTSYELDKKELKYFCGPFKGKILIADIKEITKNTTKWVGYKPATARKGIIIKYKKYDDIYISPDSNVAFIKEILKIKANIKIS